MKVLLLAKLILALYEDPNEIRLHFAGPLWSRNIGLRKDLTIVVYWHTNASDLAYDIARKVQEFGTEDALDKAIVDIKIMIHCRIDKLQCALKD